MISAQYLDIEVVDVFTSEGRGGNPCAVIMSAKDITDDRMQNSARRVGHEVGFVLRPPSADFDLALRFWVPNHEMEICGDATIGALWLLDAHGFLAANQVSIATPSGPVTAFVKRDNRGESQIEITQSTGRVRDLDSEASRDVIGALGLEPADLLDLPLQNATTSRTKTLVPLKDPDRLQAIEPNLVANTRVCTAVGSTGLYPYSPHPGVRQIFEARQFPRLSGYPEDAASGIAATALAFGLWENGLIEPSSYPIQVMQGRAMGRLSEITVRLGFVGTRPIGCVLSGTVARA